MNCQCGVPLISPFEEEKQRCAECQLSDFMHANRKAPLLAGRDTPHEADQPTEAKP
jgi:hypothetical protein